MCVHKKDKKKKDREKIKERVQSERARALFHKIMSNMGTKNAAIGDNPYFSTKTKF
jgi:hypothetical protein